MGGVSRGPKNGNWKGGRSVTSHGYVLIRVGVGHPLADCRGYAYEHRLVAAEQLGRKLRRREIAHHKDKNRANNVPRNIEVLPSIAAHRIAHRKPGSKSVRVPGQPNPWLKCACGCGRALRKFDKWRRVRRFISGHNLSWAK